MDVDEIKNYLKDYIKDFGEIKDLESKISKLQSKSYTEPTLMKRVEPYGNKVFLLEGIIREDLKEKGLNNEFAQDIIIFRYNGEVHHIVENYLVNVLDEYLHVIYEEALEVFGDNLKELLNRDPAELFEEKVGTIQTPTQLYMRNLLARS